MKTRGLDRTRIEQTKIRRRPKGSGHGDEAEVAPAPGVTVPSSGPKLRASAPRSWPPRPRRVTSPALALGLGSLVLLAVVVVTRALGVATG